LATVWLWLGAGNRRDNAVCAFATVLTWLALVHSSRMLFAAWMRAAGTLQGVVATTLFIVCYLVVVPMFRVLIWFRDPLQLRRPPQQTSWVARTATVDAASMERMG
jgi:hypothetical protein